MQIEVLTGPQGGGKSKLMREETIAAPGLYLFALPTTELIDEQVLAFLKDKPSLVTRSIYAAPNKGRTSVRLTQAREEIEAHGIQHAVLFTTHATLMDHALEGFDDWHIRIDEAPAAIQAGRFNIAITVRPWLERSFDLLVEPKSDWSALRFKDGVQPDWRSIERDPSAGKLGEFIKQAKLPYRAFVKATDWGTVDEIEWFSMWSPLQLSHCASVQVAGSSYTDSVGFKAVQSLFSDRLGFVLREVGEKRTGQPQITIHYFTRGHDGTTTFWGTSPGRFAIKAVCDHLGKALPASGYWSGNGVVEVLMDHRLKASLIKPLAMGLNKHRAARACGFIYSAKATNDDAPVMEVFELTKDQIRHAREDDAIAQFVMRGAIRDGDYGGPYAIYLYGEEQAERLRDHLTKIGFTDVTLQPVDEAGIMDLKRAKAAPAGLTPEERKAQRKAKDAARKKASRAAKALAQGRPTSANQGRGGRPKKPPSV